MTTTKRNFELVVRHRIDEGWWLILILLAFGAGRLTGRWEALFDGSIDDEAIEWETL